MKYVKMLGLLAVAAAAMMAFAGSASANITSPPGTQYEGTLTATAGVTTLHGGVTITCQESHAVGTVTKGETNAPATVSFNKCEPDTVEVKNSGSLAVESNGTVKSSGAEVTVVTHRTVLGFPVTAHCIYTTNNTSVGTLTENVEPAVLHIGSSPIPRVTTDSACGETSVWTGSYTVSTPAGKIVVD
jgi:hypothetical protein